MSNLSPDGTDPDLFNALAEWEEDATEEPGHEESHSQQADSCLYHLPFTTLLPSELLQRVLSFLSADDLMACQKTCTTFNQFASDDVLWRRLFCARWGKPGQQHSELSWKAQYVTKDTEECNNVVGMPESELYLLALRARRQQSLGRNLVDDRMPVPRCELQERLLAWRRANNVAAPNMPAPLKPDLRGRGRDAYSWDRIGDYFCCRETGWIHLCDQSCRESIIDPAHDMLVCPYSARTVERMVTDSELVEQRRVRAGPRGHDEADDLGWGGFIGRAYERGYNARNDRELKKAFFG